MKTYDDRSSMNIEDTWNLEAIYPSEEDFEKELNYIKSKLVEFDDFKERFLDSPKNYLEYEKFAEDLYRRASKAYSYARMKSDQDARNGQAQANNQKALSLVTELEAASSFFQPAVLSADIEKINEIINHPDTAIYKHHLERILAKKDYTLSEKEEKLLAQLGISIDSPGHIYATFNNADLTFPKVKDENENEVEITQGNFIPLLESKDRRVRKDTFEAFYARYKEFENTLAATLDGEVRARKTLAEIKGYKSARHAALAENNIPESVYDNLLSSVEKHLPTMHKYMELKRKVLDVDKLHMYDIYVPIIDAYDKKFSFEEGEKLVKESVKVLGEDYHSIAKEGFANRWMDKYENTGKRSGAYSGGAYDTMPYILLNYHGTLDNVFTITHELGHSIHSYYTRKNQPFIYGDYSIFLAEIASTTNEALLLQYMLSEAKTNDEKKALLVKWIEGFRTTVFRQTMFAEFEYIIKTYVEEGGTLTAEYLNKVYYDLNVKYYGKDMIIDEEIASEWSRIPHFYYNYYVYQYSTGFCTAQLFSQRILNKEEGALEKYLNFLKAGNSKDPIDVLKDADVDMTKKDTVDKALEKFDSLVNELWDLLF